MMTPLCPLVWQVYTDLYVAFLLADQTCWLVTTDTLLFDTSEKWQAELVPENNIL